MTDTQRDTLLAALAALAFFLPGTADPYQTPRLLALGAAALWLLTRPARGWSALEPVLLAGLLTWTVAAICGRDAAYSVLGSHLSPFDSLTAVMVCAGLTVGVARVGATVEDAAVTLCWASLPVAVYAIFQRAVGGADPILPAPLPNLRAVASQGSPIYLGGVLSLSAAAAAGVLPRRPVLAGTALALALPALWFTGTRGAVLGAAAAALVLLPPRWKVAALVAAGGAFLARTAGVAAADMGRLEVWRLALELFRAEPWTGVGPGSFYTAFRGVISPLFVATHGSVGAVQAHAHNQVLHVLATTGIVGLAGYLAVVGGVLAVIRRHADRALLTAAVAAYAVPAMFNPVAHSTTAALALLVGAAAARGGARMYAPTVHFWRVGCALSVALAGTVAVSDAFYASAVYAGRANDPMGYLRCLRTASAWGLNQPQTTARYLDGLMRAMPHVPGEQRVALVDESLRAAQAVMDHHPTDPWAWEMAGRSVQLAAATGLPYAPEQAAEMLEVAQELAPTFLPIAERRLLMARLLGDKAGEVRARADIDRVSAWVRGRI